MARSADNERVLGSATQIETALRRAKSMMSEVTALARPSLGRRCRVTRRRRITPAITSKAPSPPISSQAWLIRHRATHTAEAEQ